MGRTLLPFGKSKKKPSSNNDNISTRNSSSNNNSSISRSPYHGNQANHVSHAVTPSLIDHDTPKLVMLNRTSSAPSAVNSSYHTDAASVTPNHSFSQPQLVTPRRSFGGLGTGSTSSGGHRRRLFGSHNSSSANVEIETTSVGKLPLISSRRSFRRSASAVEPAGAKKPVPPPINITSPRVSHVVDPTPTPRRSAAGGTIIPDTGLRTAASSPSHPPLRHATPSLLATLDVHTRNGLNDFEVFMSSDDYAERERIRKQLFETDDIIEDDNDDAPEQPPLADRTMMVDHVNESHDHNHRDDTMMMLMTTLDGASQAVNVSDNMMLVDISGSTRGSVFTTSVLEESFESEATYARPDGKSFVTVIVNTMEAPFDESPGSKTAKMDVTMEEEMGPYRYQFLQQQQHEEKKSNDTERPYGDDEATALRNHRKDRNDTNANSDSHGRRPKPFMTRTREQRGTTDKMEREMSLLPPLLASENTVNSTSSASAVEPSTSSTTQTNSGGLQKIMSAMAQCGAGALASVDEAVEDIRHGSSARRTGPTMQFGCFESVSTRTRPEQIMDWFYYRGICAPTHVSPDVIPRRRPYFDETFATEFLHTLIQPGISLLYLVPPATPPFNTSLDWKGRSVTMMLEPGNPGSSSFQPTLEWSTVAGGRFYEVETTSIPLLQIQSVSTNTKRNPYGNPLADTDHPIPEYKRNDPRDEYPSFDHPVEDHDDDDDDGADLCFFTITSQKGDIHVFETASIDQRNQMVNGLRNIIARLAFHLIAGDVGASSEIYHSPRTLKIESEPNASGSDLPLLTNPQQTMDRMTHALLDS